MLRPRPTVVEKVPSLFFVSDRKPLGHTMDDTYSNNHGLFTDWISGWSTKQLPNTQCVDSSPPWV